MSTSRKNREGDVHTEWSAAEVTAVEHDGLISRARQGDRHAFDELLSSYRERLRALVHSRLTAYLQKRVEVEDILQETSLRGFRSMAGFDAEDGESFLRWMGGIANHVILEVARREKRDTIVPVDDEVTVAPAHALSPSRLERRKERFERLEKALRSLDSDHQRVILLARIERLPMREVAKRMGRSPGAATQLLWRALRKLKEFFGSTDSLHLPPRTLEGQGDDHGQ